MPLKKLERFTKQVSDLPDTPSMSAVELKSYFDASPEEVRQALNLVVEVLMSAESGDSGADNVGASTIPGVDGTSVQAMLESLKTQLDDVSVGQLKNTTLTANASLIPTGNVGSIEQLISWITNRIKIMTGTANWYDPIAELAKKEQGSWVNLVLENGITNAFSGETAACRLDDFGNVRLSGYLNGLNGKAAGTRICRLPYTPSKKMRVPVYNSGNFIGLVNIELNGELITATSLTGNFISLDNITYPTK